MKKLWIVCALFVSAVMVLGSLNAAALSRMSGDFWTYDISANVLGANITGTATYTFERQDTVTVNGTSYPVNVMRVTGSLGGTVVLIVTLQVNATVDGFVYETQSGMSIARVNATAWANTTIGIAPAQFRTSSVFGTLTSFSPPILSKFDPVSTKPGDAWSESVYEGSRTVTVNGTETIVQYANATTTYNVTTSDSLEQVHTAAGAFDCLKMNVSSGSQSGYALLWWSSDVGNFVMAKPYGNSSSSPLATIILKDFSNKKSSSLLYIGIGVGVLVVALVILAAVLLMRRRGKEPANIQQAPPTAPLAPPGP